MIRLLAWYTLSNEEVFVCNCKILEDESLSREEKSSYARFLMEEAQNNHPEYSYFHFEKDFSYFDEDGCWDYFYSIATEEEGLEGEEATEYADKMTEESVREHYDIGFDY